MKKIKNFNILLILMMLALSSCSPRPISLESKIFSGRKSSFEAGRSGATFKDIGWSKSENVVLQDADLRVTSWSFAIYLGDLNTAGVITPVVINDEVVYGHFPELSYDGNYLAFFDAEKEQIHIMDVRKSDTPQTVALLSKEYNGRISWLPNNQELALIKYETPERLGVYIFDLNGEMVDKLEFSDLRFKSYSTAHNISWSPDGQKIAFLLYENLMNQQIFVVEIQTDNIFQITSKAGTVYGNISWAPNSQQIIFPSTSSDAVEYFDAQLTLALADGSCKEETESLGIIAVDWGPVLNDLIVIKNGKAYIISIDELGFNISDGVLSCP